MTAAHSRFMLARMIPTRKTPDLLLGALVHYTESPVGS
jgi:hypothetical protein